MKLLEKGNRITLFEGGIVVDENLLKYKKRYNRKSNFKFKGRP